MGTALRLELAREAGLELPTEGKIGVFGGKAGLSLPDIPMDRLIFEARHFPDHKSFEQAGAEVTAQISQPLSMALVILPRAKAEARALLARAVSLVEGPLVVDGQKTDGIDAMIKALRQRVDLPGVVSKAHGKIAWTETPPDLTDWAEEHGARKIEGGFVTAPGVFSADAPDPASVLLADSLPEKLGARVADLGSGWGYLSRRILERPKVTNLDLVEADCVALDCARANIRDDRARFHWADASTWGRAESVDCVVTNPPFHTGRQANPDLGRAFIGNASRILRRSGALWLVANRHLPYEAALDRYFGVVEPMQQAKGFKIIRAARPRP